MNKILKKRIEELPYKKIHPYNTEVNDAYNKGFEEGAFFAMQSQWISVEDTLPKNGENVFAVDSDDAYVAWFDETDKTWQELSDGHFIVPTHWMPIPKFEMKENELRYDTSKI